MKKILIVEDNKKIRDELKELLCRYEYEVYAPTSFDDIVKNIIDYDPHLLILDINLPIDDGYLICKKVREVSNLPIIVVTSRDSDIDELMSMTLGADDFITKPYNVSILLARISALMKRTYETTKSDVLIYNDITLNLSKNTFFKNGVEYELTKNEFKILYYLIKNKGSIVSRDALMEYLWTSELFIDDNTLTVNVNRLRKTLEGAGLKNAIQTKRGLGYMMP